MVCQGESKLFWFFHIFFFNKKIDRNYFQARREKIKETEYFHEKKQFQ